MDILKNKNFRKWIVVLLSAVFLFVLLVPSLSLAQTAPPLPKDSGASFFSLFSLNDMFGKAVAWVVYVLSYIVGIIAGAVLTALTWLISVLLNINTAVVTSPIVQDGFAVMLSIANLGFILAIIIIALATILRNQTYGVKQLLWKLIVAAILVNFSLTIAGDILAFSNNFSNYFIQSYKNPTDFASKIAGASAPQDWLTQQGINKNDLSSISPTLDKVGAAGEDFGSTLSLFLSMFFPIIVSIIFVVSFLALAVMLVIRYVIIAFLLILMPLAWLAWIFPGLQNNWSKWWQEFIRWTFFPPIVLFFLWLSLDLMTKIGQVTSAAHINDANSIIQNRFLASVLTGFITPLLQQVLLIGFTIGGLFVANSLGIASAGAAIGAVKGTSNWVAGKIGKGTAYPLRTATGRKWGATLQKFGTGTGFGSKFARFTGIAGAVQGVGRSLETGAVVTGEKEVGKATKQAESLVPSQLQNQLRTSYFALDKSKFIGQLMAADKKDLANLGDTPELVEYLKEENRSFFERNGQGKFFDELRNKSGVKLKELTDVYNNASPGAEKDAAFEEIIKHFKGAPNAGSLAETFFPNIDKLKAKATREGKSLQEVMPAKMNEQSLKEIQDAIIMGASKGFSAKNWSSFTDKLTRGDNFDSFNETIKRTGLHWQDLSDPARRYFSGNTAKNLGFAPEMFPGYKEAVSQPKAKTGEEVSEGGVIIARH